MILDCARARSGALGALRLLICGLGATLAAALAGCSTSSPVDAGTPVVTVHTDAASDFTTYVVGITLYSLTRTDGYIAYPAGYTAEEFADLTQRVDLTELLNAIGIATGTYTSVVVGIDYSMPIIYLKGQSAAATVENTSGTADFGVVYVTIRLDPAHPLVIGLNQTSRLALDFDLGASNSIDETANTVIARPYAVATTTPTDTEPVRARGLFVVADPSSSYFIENIRPFDDSVYGTVGALTVNTTPTTYYNINGNVYTGAAGLAEIKTLPGNEPTIAYGSIDKVSNSSNSSNSITPSFTATQVYAGLAVANGQYEHIRGIVSAISGDTLTVAGATYLYYYGYCTSNLCFTYYPTATITVGPSTVVTKDGEAVTGLSTQSVSVGQQIDAMGVGTLSSAGALSMDATSGLVQLTSTPIWGTLNSGTASSATINLLQAGQFGPSTFNYAGTGTSSANDATAANYVVDTGTTDESATTVGTLLRADGFTTPFGSAPPDFTAADVIPGGSYPADLVLEWNSGDGTTSPFTSYDSSSLVVNLANATTADVEIGPQTIPLVGTPAINISVGDQFSIGNYTNGISVFSTPGAFAVNLTNTLNGSTSVYRVVAVGSYDAATNTFAASRVDVALE